MVFNKVLNSIFSTSSHISVLRALQHYKTGISGREIARISGLSPKSALSALSSLEEIKIVKRVIGGRDHLFTLNRENYLVINGILQLLQVEDSFLLQLLSLIKQKLSKQCISIILFGSVARNEETPESDLDICFVVQNRIAQNNILHAVHDLQDKIYKVYGASLAPVIFTLNEFKKSASKKLPPVNSIIREGTLISGKPIKIIIHGA